MGRQAFGAPDRGLESSFRCWIAGRRLARKERLFTDTGMPPRDIVSLRASSPSHLQACVPRHLLHLPARRFEPRLCPRMQMQMYSTAGLRGASQRGALSPPQELTRAHQCLASNSTAAARASESPTAHSLLERPSLSFSVELIDLFSASGPNETSGPRQKARWSDTALKK